MNSIVVIGRVTKEPEYKATDRSAFSSFTVASHRRAGGEDVTDFFDVTAFGKSGEFVSNYVSKGDLVYVQGEMRQRTYTNAAGVKVYSWGIGTNVVEKLSSTRKPDEDAETPDEDLAERMSNLLGDSGAETSR